MKLLNLLLGTFQAADYGNFGYNSYEYENLEIDPRDDQLRHLRAMEYQIMGQSTDSLG